MIPDYHMHSSFSDDADTDISVLIKSAMSLGMSSMCITDHHDKDYPKTPDEKYFNLNIPEYLNHMLFVKEKYKADFDLKIGMEVGVMPDTAHSLNSLVAKYKDFDFIIASSHIVDNEDPYYPGFFEGKSEKEAYKRYFETILENVKLFKNYNVYGHLDYILRYGPTKADNFNIDDYIDIFEAVFKIIIPEGKGIEVNTGSLYRGLSFPHPHIKTLRLYKAMGGEIITLGSDSHDKDHIGFAFKETTEMLKKEGFKYYCTFSKMKPSFNEL